ncbi:variant leucine-rich repeat-containing protein [Streptomyces sp. P9-A2]|uniref:variant leucine-rich repeat-containing protein n=1 Tax=Streptomyces sp. P9-A2 TaxID=3072284 RepID=UPI002FC90A90
MTSLAHPQLSGLGRNPAAPQDVLVRLAAHAAGRHGISLRRGRLADAVVEALLTHGGRGTATGLHGDRLSPAMRRRVAEHPDPAIRDAYPDFVRGTVDLGVPLGIDALEETYGRPRAVLAGAPSPKLRAAVARSWHDRPPTVQEGLLADPDPQVRAAATEHKQPGVPPEWRDRCLADPAVRANVARYVPLASDRFAQLMRSEDETVHQAVAGNPHLSAEMVARLLDIDDPFVRVAVAQSRHVDAETRDGLYALVEAELADGNIEAEVALSWNFTGPDWLRDVPLEERMTYLDCPYAAFRRVLASCHDLPEEAWHRLDNDRELMVRRAAARRPDAPPEVLERLVRAHGDVFHIRPLLVDHPNFPRHTLHTFVDEPSPNARYVALQDPELPVASLQRLAGDSEPFLRRGVARHPNVTEALLEQLLSDRDPEVVDDAAANSALRLSPMHRILATAGL